MAETSVHRGSDECRAAVWTAHHPCCLCGRSDSEFLFHARDRLHGCEGSFAYVRCAGCGLVYMDPQIVPEDLPRVYPSDYGPHHANGKKRQSRRSLQAVIRKTPFVSRVCAGFNSQSRLLDVGCGSGAFLHAIGTLTGCEIYGVDISRAAVAAAKQGYGVEVFAGTLPEAPFADESFDVVTAWWYLEHVPNPVEVLRKVHQLLKPGGLSIMGVPNVDSLNARVFRDRWFHLDCPRHLHLYSPTTITRLLGQAGFVVEGIAFDPGTRGLLQSLRYRFGADGVPLSRRRDPPGFHLMKALARPWTRLVALLRQADLIVVCARKAEPLSKDLFPRDHGTQDQDRP
jgi:SAM-dependent methyltransferase